METIKEIGKISALELADFILSTWGSMSHLKLQKLVYYCDAYHLAYFNVSLVNEDFEAWVHGPVCKEIYNHLKGTSVLYADVSFNNSYNPNEVFSKNLNSSQRELIMEIVNELSQWSGYQLENSTHNEEPWIEARKGFGPADICNAKISKDTMKNFFKKELNV